MLNKSRRQYAKVISGMTKTYKHLPCQYQHYDFLKERKIEKTVEFRNQLNIR